MPKQLEANEKSHLVLKLGNKIPFLGLICALLAGLSFTAGKLLIKQDTTVHPTINIAIRGFIMTVFYGLIISSKRLNFFGDSRKQFFCLCGRGFFGFLVTISSYIALLYISLGDSITLILTATIFTSVFARLFLGEEFTFVNLFCVLITMIGVILIAGKYNIFCFLNFDLIFNHFLLLFYKILQSHHFYLIMAKKCTISVS